MFHFLESSKHFGLVPVLRGRHRIEVTDPSRTVIDLLASPTWGGGNRRVAEMITECSEMNQSEEAPIIGGLFAERDLLAGGGSLPVVTGPRIRWDVLPVPTVLRARKLTEVLTRKPQRFGTEVTSV